MAKKKKWYESGWTWTAIGVGVFLFLRSKKAAAAPGVLITKIPPSWDPIECDPVPAPVKPYIAKFKQAVEAAFGVGSAGAFCVTISEYGTDIDMQMFVGHKSRETTVGLNTLKAKSVQSLADAIKADIGTVYV